MQRLKQLIMDLLPHLLSTGIQPNWTIPLDCLQMAECLRKENSALGDESGIDEMDGFIWMQDEREDDHSLDIPNIRVKLIDILEKIYDLYRIYKKLGQLDYFKSTDLTQDQKEEAKEFEAKLLKDANEIRTHLMSQLRNVNQLVNHTHLLEVPFDILQTLAGEVRDYKGEHDASFDLTASFIGELELIYAQRAPNPAFQKQYEEKVRALSVTVEQVQEQASLPAYQPTLYLPTNTATTQAAVNVEKQQQVASDSTELTAVKTKMAELQKELDKANKALAESQKDHQRTLSRLSETMKQLNRDLSQQQQAQDHLLQSHVRQKHTLASALEQIDSLQASLKRHEDYASSLKHECTLLEEQLATTRKHHESELAALNASLTQTHDKQIKDVIQETQQRMLKRGFRLAGGSLLHDAVIEENPVKVDYCLSMDFALDNEGRPDSLKEEDRLVNHRDEKGLPPLCYALQIGNYDMIKHLLRYDPSLDFPYVDRENKINTPSLQGYLADLGMPEKKKKLNKFEHCIQLLQKYVKFSKFYQSKHIKEIFSDLLEFQAIQDCIEIIYKTKKTMQFLSAYQKQKIVFVLTMCDMMKQYREAIEKLLDPNVSLQDIPVFSAGQIERDIKRAEKDVKEYTADDKCLDPILANALRRCTQLTLKFVNYMENYTIARKFELELHQANILPRLHKLKGAIQLAGRSVYRDHVKSCVYTVISSFNKLKNECAAENRAQFEALFYQAVTASTSLLQNEAVTKLETLAGHSLLFSQLAPKWEWILKDNISNRMAEWKRNHGEPVHLNTENRSARLA